ncbi:hypothetical protein U1701_05485 [Sphingomonas sp. PB2P19]|uniref:hypothetical protein n=1 Tax=Sphingomonas rhamnosi TaxID=3096156 RepID=UPI002FC6AC4F
MGTPIGGRPAAVASASGTLTAALLMARLAKLRPERLVIVEEAPSTCGAMHDLFPQGSSYVKRERTGVVTAGAIEAPTQPASDEPLHSAGK